MFLPDVKPRVVQSSAYSQLRLLYQIPYPYTKTGGITARRMHYQSIDLVCIFVSLIRSAPIWCKAITWLTLVVGSVHRCSYQLIRRDAKLNTGPTAFLI